MPGLTSTIRIADGTAHKLARAGSLVERRVLGTTFLTPTRPPFGWRGPFATLPLRAVGKDRTELVGTGSRGVDREPVGYNPTPEGYLALKDGGKAPGALTIIGRKTLMAPSTCKHVDLTESVALFRWFGPLKDQSTPQEPSFRRGRLLRKTRSQGDHPRS